MIFLPGIAIAGSFLGKLTRTQTCTYPALPFYVQLAPGDSLTPSVGAHTLTNITTTRTSPIAVWDGALIQTHGDVLGMSTTLTTGDGHTTTLKTQTTLAVKQQGDSAGFVAPMQSPCDYLMLEGGGVSCTNATKDAGSAEPTTVCAIVMQTKHTNTAVRGCTFAESYSAATEQTVIILYDAFPSTVGTSGTTAIPGTTYNEVAPSQISVDINSVVNVAQIAQNNLAVMAALQELFKSPVRPIALTTHAGKHRAPKLH